MKEILLTQNKVTLVDDEDYERLAQYNWQYTNGYAARNIWIPSEQKNKQLSIAKEILQTEKDVDHKDRNRLNNQRFNLRLCTYSQNNQNKKKEDGLTSRYKGVSFCSARKKWYSCIGLYDLLHKKTYNKNLGRFSSEKDAAEAYDEAARFYFKEFATLNFPRKEEQSCL